MPLGVSIALSHFRGKRLVASIFNTLLSMPTVVVGLTVYAFLYRQGPLGALGLLFTPWAVIIGDVPPGAVMYGNPARPHRRTLEESVMLEFLAKNRKVVKRLIHQAGAEASKD